MPEPSSQPTLVVLGASSLVADRFIALCGSEFSTVIRCGRSEPVRWRAGSGELPALSGSAPVVLNAAAAFAEASYEDARECLATNVVGALEAAELGRRSGCALIVHLSTISVVDVTSRRGFYGLSKAQAEEVLEAYCARQQIPLLIVRLSQIVDAAGKARRHQPFFYAVLERVAGGKDVVIEGDPAIERNYLFLDDACTSLLELIRARRTGTVTLLNPQRMPLELILNTMRDRLGSESRISFEPEKNKIRPIAIPFEDNAFDAGVLTATPLGLADIIDRISAHDRGQ